MNTKPIGIPYAPWVEPFEANIHKCPVCGKLIQEPDSKGLEYAKHFDREHN